MKMINRQPQIRFWGFNDDWEQRKCEGILKPIKGAMKIGPFGSALKKEFYTETGVKVYAQENIFQEDFTIGDYYISEERYQTLKGCKLEPGDLVISMMGTIGACAIFPNNAEPGIMNSHLLRLQLNDDIYPEYIHQLLRDSQIIRSQIDRLSVGSIMSGLSSSVVQKLIFPIPSLDEQKKIAEFLTQLDKTITLHQRKCDKLINIKKSMLEKMFPQKGEKTPEIRFSGFTDDWEQRKFGDVGSVAMCKRIFKEQTSEEGDVPFYKIGTFGGTPDAYISRELFEEYKKAYQYPNKGDILISASGSIGRTVEYTGEDEYFQDSNIVWLKHGDIIDNAFLKVLYSVVEWSCEGSTIKRLYNDNFLKTEFMLPYIEEQTKIGELFSQIDNLITLHQRKLEKLIIIKKSMLEKMFV